MAERERMRLSDAREANWARFGPYLSERQWGTVREDYSRDGNCWAYFTHDQARSRAYRWGEDALLCGLTDHQARLCFGVALWNGRDPILKERLFGLTNAEGNHGEDVKELYFYEEATPTFSWMKTRYMYPHRYPYEELTSVSPGLFDREFEIEDTTAFEKFWDVQTEMAKESENCVYIRVAVTNFGPKDTLVLIPQLTFRNTWSWSSTGMEAKWGKPFMSRNEKDGNIDTQHSSLGAFKFSFVDPKPVELIFAENETNAPKLFGTPRQEGQRFKDGFHSYIVGNDRSAVSHEGGAGVFRVQVDNGKSASFVFCLHQDGSTSLATAEACFAKRRAEHAEYYASIMSKQCCLTEEERKVYIAASAGLLFSKQFYYYDLETWLKGDDKQPPPPPDRLNGRNSTWHKYFFARDILTIPDGFEYPWFAAWDLAFQCIALAEIDLESAKSQLVLLLREWYMGANGAIPAYEFNFDDVNPPVHVLAVWKCYRKSQEIAGDKNKGDRQFLATCFHKLLLNWSWWINRKDTEGHGVLGGGFLGLDNISVFDRTNLPPGIKLEQADGTAWSSVFCNNMFKIAVELAHYDKSYEDIASSFFEHFVRISTAINNFGGTGLWDEEDGFYYDKVKYDNGDAQVLRVRSLVGIVPIFSTINVAMNNVKEMRGLQKRTEWFLQSKPHLRKTIKASSTEAHLNHAHAQKFPSMLKPVDNDLRLPSLFQLSLPSERKFEKILKYLFDENEFLSPFGFRSLSKVHQTPFLFHGIRLEYAPGESTSNMFGGNSNWRGPLWFPMNFLIIESIERMGNFSCEKKVEFPTNSGQYLTYQEIAANLWIRMANLFLPDAESNRPCNGGHPLFKKPHFKDCLRFHEYFHGCSGRGCGASQQGWTFLILVALRRIGENRSK